MTELKEQIIYCCKCQKDVNVRLTNGEEIYPHRDDLAKLFFWICDSCGNYVGTHKVSIDHKPLGVIPSPEIRALRMQIHSILDPIWKSGKVKRSSLYKEISETVAKKYHTEEYHTANIKTIEEANTILDIVKTVADKYNVS